MPRGPLKLARGSDADKRPLDQVKGPLKHAKYPLEAYLKEPLKQVRGP